VRVIVMKDDGKDKFVAPFLRVISSGRRLRRYSTEEERKRARALTNAKSSLRMWMNNPKPAYLAVAVHYIKKYNFKPREFKD
jgi:hypothetical protein